MTGKLNKTD